MSSAAVPAGTRSAKAGATRQAERLRRRELGQVLAVVEEGQTSPAPASASGFTSWIRASGIGARRPAARRPSPPEPPGGSGAALSKNPGCSIEPPSDMRRRPPRHSAAAALKRSIRWRRCPGSAGGLEPGRSAEPDQLLVVVGLLRKALAISRRSGPSGEFQMMLTPAEARIGGVVGQADAGCVIAGGAARVSWILGAGARAEQRAGVGEHGAAHAEIVGNERQREAHLGRRRPEGSAAERVAGVQVARAEAAAVEAADGLAALVEEVEQAHVLAAPALDVAADARGRRR